MSILRPCRHITTAYPAPIAAEHGDFERRGFLYRRTDLGEQLATGHHHRHIADSQDCDAQTHRRSIRRLLVSFQQICPSPVARSEEHTSELQSQSNLVCRLLLEKKKKKKK